MAYLVKRKRAAECAVGENLIVVKDWNGLKAGTVGKVNEILPTSILVEWQKPTRSPSVMMITNELLNHVAFQVKGLEAPGANIHLGEVCANCRCLITEKGCACERARK